jgi:site-specific DNA-methyltransferase (adenine-specific)
MTTNKIYLGDCLTVMKKIKGVHLVLADPPYDYDIVGSNWNQKELERRIKHSTKSNHAIKYFPYGNARRGGARNERWFEKEKEHIAKYIRFTETWTKRAYRCLLPGGYIVVFCKSTSLGHIQQALENQNFFVKDVVTLIKSTNIRKGISLHQAKKRRGLELKEFEKAKCTVLNCLTEFAIIAHKPFSSNNTSYLDQWLETKTGFIDTRRLPSNILSFKKEAISKELDHINRKPLDIIEAFVGGLCPKRGIVLDPFAGSGTTGVACKKLGRSSLLIEKERKYCRIAKRRAE